MRLEYTPDLLMWIIFGCVKGGFNLCRMMRIIINDRYITNFAFILESAVCTAEIFQTIKDHFCRQVKKLSCSDRCQSIGYIVNARHFQRTCAQVFSLSLIHIYALNLAMDTIDKLSEQMYRQTGNRLVRTMSETLSGITGGDVYKSQGIDYEAHNCKRNL